MTGSDIQAMLDCPRLSPRQREVVALRYVAKLPYETIARRLGMASGVARVYAMIARRKMRLEADSPKAINRPIDEAWHQRQVAYVRGLEDGHRVRYLRGISIAHGQAVADRVERESDE